jgi:hypothetical protein
VRSVGLRALLRVPEGNILQAALRRVRVVLALAALIGLLGVLARMAFPWVNERLGDCDAHLALQLRGEALSTECEQLSLADLRNSLWRDTLFAAGYGVVIAGLSLPSRPAHHLDRRVRGLATWGSFAALGAAFADAIENGLLAVWVTDTPAGFLISGEWHTNVVAAVALTKWTLLVVAVVALLWAVSGGFAERPFPLNTAPRPSTWRQRLRAGRHQLGVWWRRNRWRIDPRADPPVLQQPDSEPEDERQFDQASIMLCCSGGGIRSAGFTLGALYELEQAGLADRVRTLAAVSGGNYAATAWTLQRAVTAEQRAAGPVPPAADAVIRRLMDRKNPIAVTGWKDSEALLRVRLDEKSAAMERSTQGLGRHRYLANNSGGLARSVLFGIGAVLSNLVQILSVLVPLGWLLGTFLALPDVHPTLSRGLEHPSEFAISDHHWQPALLLIGVAVALLAFSALVATPSRQALLKWPAVLFATTGALALALLVVAPWTMVQFARLGDERARAFTIGGISLLTVAASVFRLVADPLRRQAPRLGGAVLGIGLVLLLGKVATDTIDGDGVFSHPSLVLGFVIVFVASAFVVDTQTASIRELYRTRLTASFCRDESGDTSQVTWDDLRQASTHVPELVVCCAASRVGLAPNGIPAESFTISQHRVRHYRASGQVSVTTERYTSTLRSLAQRRLAAPAGWMATSGAAFASSMGQASLGSTNALLGALNADLGIWLPAPRVVATPTAPDLFPPVRLGHLVNEIFGIYAENDEQVFVADGGHVENLGLLELLHEALRIGLEPGRPHTIVSIDASGDEPGSFATLRAALRVADTVLPERLWFDTSELDSSRLPAESSAYTIPFWRWEDRPPAGSPAPSASRVGTIYYAKLQPSLDQSDAVRSFAMIDPKFPRYSTANQLLDDQQFAFLLTAGRDAAKAVRTRLEHD